MDNKNLSKISNILTDVFENLGLTYLVEEKTVRDSWEKAVGDRVAKFTEVQKFHKKKLYVKVAHSTWKMELRFETKTIVKKLNQILGGETVEEIIFL